MTAKPSQIRNYLLFTCLLLGCFVLIYHAWMPFYAERYFRDGFQARFVKSYGRAITNLEKSKELAPWETHYHVELGRAYEDQAKSKKSRSEKLKYLKKAEELYTYVMSIDWNNPWYKHRMAIVKQSLATMYKDSDAELYNAYLNDAERFHRESSSTDQNNPLFHLNLAYFLHQFGRAEDALPFYKRALAIDERLGEARYNIAAMYRDQGRLDDAMAEYMTLYDIKPNFPRLREAIAAVHMEKNERPKAMAFLEEAHQHDPKNISVIRNLLTVYFQEEQWAKSIPVYESMFKRYPKMLPEYHEFYVRALVHDGYIGKGYESTLSYLKLFPDDQVAKNQSQSLLEIINDIRKKQ